MLIDRYLEGRVTSLVIQIDLQMHEHNAKPLH